MSVEITWTQTWHLDDEEVQDYLYADEFVDPAMFPPMFPPCPEDLTEEERAKLLDRFRSTVDVSDMIDGGEWKVTGEPDGPPTVYCCGKCHKRIGYGVDECAGECQEEADDDS